MEKVGDVFDKESSLSILKKKGGFVILSFGNHEYILQNDLRYTYHKTPFLLGIEYKELYGKNTVKIVAIIK